MNWQKTQVTKNRLNKMCKYFKNKYVKIRYEYNNSIGWHDVEEAECTYDEFKITIMGDWQKSAEIVFIEKGEKKFTFFIDSIESAEFTGVGAIHIENSGPYCFFRITQLTSQEK